MANNYLTFSSEEENTNKYIRFDGKDYTADLAPITEGAEEIQNALSTMNGEGETVVFNGSAHRIDSTKAAQRRSDLVSFIGTIGGNDMKLKIGNNEYSIDSSKLSADKEEIRALLKSLSGDEESAYSIKFINYYEEYKDDLLSYREIVFAGTSYYSDDNGEIYLENFKFDQSYEFSCIPSYSGNRFSPHYDYENFEISVVKNGNEYIYSIANVDDADIEFNAGTGCLTVYIPWVSNIPL